MKNPLGLFTIAAIAILLSCGRSEEGGKEPGETIDIAGLELPVQYDFGTGDLVTIKGIGFKEGDLIRISSSAIIPLDIIPAEISYYGLTFTVPGSIPAGMYTVTLLRGEKQKILGRLSFAAIVPPNLYAFNGNSCYKVNKGLNSAEIVFDLDGRVPYQSVASPDTKEIFSAGTYGSAAFCGVFDPDKGSITELYNDPDNSKTYSLGYLDNTPSFLAAEGGSLSLYRGKTLSLKFNINDYPPDYVSDLKLGGVPFIALEDGWHILTVFNYTATAGVFDVLALVDIRTGYTVFDTRTYLHTSLLKIGDYICSADWYSRYETEINVIDTATLSRRMNVCRIQRTEVTSVIYDPFQNCLFGVAPYSGGRYRILRYNLEFRDITVSVFELDECHLVLAK